MNNLNISLQQLDYMKHALGNNIKKTYRNYFCAGASDVPIWEDLFKKGYAHRNYEEKDLCSGIYYSVSDKGINLLKEILK